MNEQSTHFRGQVQESHKLYSYQEKYVKAMITYFLCNIILVINQIIKRCLMLSPKGLSGDFLGVVFSIDCADTHTQ